MSLNLTDNIDEAYALIKDLEPSSPQEYILKAVANTVIGQEHGAVSDCAATVSLEKLVTNKILKFVVNFFYVA